MSSATGALSDEPVSLLIDAVTRQKPDEVEALLVDGVDIDVRDANGNTALMWAAWNGLPDMVDFLAGKGASLTAVNRTGRTAGSLAETARANQLRDDTEACDRFDRTVDVIRRRLAAGDGGPSAQAKAAEEIAAEEAAHVEAARQTRAALKKSAPRVRFSP